MARPRFSRLRPEQQQTILAAAREEFAGNGYHGASLNRIIDAAGTSKGSFYYYFDSKDDLFAHLVRTDLEALFAEHGPFPVPTDRDADEFWATVEDYYLRLVTALTDAPDLVAVLRGLLAAASTPALQQAQRELEQELLPWLERAVTAGQRAGAVRTDVPSSVLVAVVLGMGQAMDTWLMGRRLDREELPGLSSTIAVLVDMMRGALRPHHLPD